MENKVFLGSVLTTLAVLALAGAIFTKGDTVVQVRTVDGEPVEVLAGQPSPDVYVHQYLRAGLTTGAVANVSTTSATYTLRDSEIRDAKVISIADTSFSSALTLTLPASTTWQSLPKNGDAQEWIIDNLHSAAATTSTITAGTGVDIDGTTANDDVINGGVSGTLRCWKLPNSDVRCIVEEMVDAG